MLMSLKKVDSFAHLGDNAFLEEGMVKDCNYNFVAF